MIGLATGIFDRCPLPQMEANIHNEWEQKLAQVLYSLTTKL